MITTGENAINASGTQMKFNVNLLELRRVSA